MASLGCNELTISNSVSNGLVPNRWQAITWTGDDLVHWYPGGGTPYIMGDTYVPRFWPPFLTLWVPNSIFLGCFFLIHQHKNDLLGTNPHKIWSFWTQNTIFPSIFLGPIFNGPRHTLSNFRTEYPPRGYQPNVTLAAIIGSTTLVPYL